MRIQLSIVNAPIVSLLPRYAHPLSILLHDRSRNLPYLLNDFSSLAYDAENETLCNPEYDWMYTGCGALTYECGVFPISILKEGTVIINFIEAMLENGRYCIIDIDEFFCSFSDHYQTKHKTSGVLVFGVDTASKVLLLNNYSENDGYQPYEVKTHEFLKAVERSCPQVVVHCFRENKSLLAPTFDKKTFINIVKEYQQTDLDLSNRARYHYGSAALRMVADKIQSGVVNPEWLKEAMLSLREHKLIMLNRVLWLIDHKEVDDSWYFVYRNIYLLAEEIYNLSIQYEREIHGIYLSSEMVCQSLGKKRAYELLRDIVEKLLCLIEKEACFISLVKTTTEAN